MSVIALSHPAVALLADDDTDKGSPIGLFVVLALIIAVYFLYRSMNRHMRKLPESFDPPAAPADDAPVDTIAEAELEQQSAQAEPELTKSEPTAPNVNASD